MSRTLAAMSLAAAVVLAACSGGSETSTPRADESTPATETITAEPTSTESTGSNDGSASAPDAFASLTGGWQAVELDVDGVAVAFGSGELTLSIFGRSFGGSDGCNGIRGGGVSWNGEGRIWIRIEGSIGADCGDDGPDLAFTDGLSSASTWELTADGNLVLEGSSTRIELEPAPSTAPFIAFVAGTLDGERALVRDYDFASLSADEALPVLTIAGSDATLSSVDCELSFQLETENGRSETPLKFVGVDPLQCPEGSTSRAVADAVGSAVYGLTTDSGGGSGLHLWSGSSEVVLFMSRR